MADQNTLEILLRIKDLATGELKRFTDGASTGGKQAETAMKGFGNQLSQVRNILAVIGIPVTFNAIASAVKAATRASFDFANAVKSGAAAMGITIEQYQILRAISIKTGTDMSLLETAFLRMNTDMEQLRKGSLDAVGKFHLFGITMQEVKNGSLGAWDAFMKIANVLGPMEDKVRRGALANDIFGRGGARLMDIFDEAGGKMEVFATTVKKEFGIMTDDQIKKLDDMRREYNKFFEDLGAAWRTFVVDTTSNLSKFNSRLEAWPRWIQTLDKIRASEKGLASDLGAEYSDLIHKGVSLEDVWRLILAEQQKRITLADSRDIPLLEKQMALLKEAAGIIKVTPPFQTSETGIKGKAEDPKKLPSEFETAWAQALTHSQDMTNAWRDTLIGAVDLTRDAVSDMLMSTIDKTNSMRDAYQNFFKSIAKMAADLLAKKAVAELFGMFISSGVSSGGGVPGGGYGVAGKASGGIFEGGFRAFQGGGITNGLTFGMIGEGDREEAVVPLPDNRSIPVKMIGGGAKNVNISFTILANDTRGFDELLMKRQGLIKDAVMQGMSSDRDFRRSIKD